VQHNDETIAKILADQRIKIVVLAADFVGYKDRKFPMMLFGYQEVVTRLRSGGKRVIVIAPIPIFDFDPPAALGIRSAWKQLPLDIGLPTQVYREQNAQAFQMLKNMQSAEQDIVLPQRVFCDSALCRSYLEGNGVLYFNSNHLSLKGARILVQGMHL
jgi:hypothetical protein